MWLPTPSEGCCVEGGAAARPLDCEGCPALPASNLSRPEANQKAEASHLVGAERQPDSQGLCPLQSRHPLVLVLM